MSRSFLFAALLSIAISTGSAPKGLGAARVPKNHGKPPTPANGAPAAVKPGAPALPPVAAKATPVPINQNAQGIVLGYHRLVTKVRRPDTEIDLPSFEAQMRQLKEQGIKVIPLQQLLAWKKGEKDIPQECAVITFDDGWKSQYEVAWPILKKYGYPFTLFIYTDYVRGGPKSGGESISWEQLAQMRDAGVDIQGHTVSHHDLTKKLKTAAFPDYDAWLWNELNGSKQLLEQRLGIKVNALALPYGRYNAHVLEMAKKAGYEAVFTVYGQKIGYASRCDSLGRYMIEANKPQTFASATRFGRQGASAPSAVAEYMTKTVPTQPLDGSSIDEVEPLISAQLESFEPFDPKTLVMRVSGFGVVDARFDAASKTLLYQPSRKLDAATYSVIVTGEAPGGGPRRQVHWSFTVTPKAAGAKTDGAAPQKPSPTPVVTGARP